MTVQMDDKRRGSVSFPIFILLFILLTYLKHIIELNLKEVEVASRKVQINII